MKFFDFLDKLLDRICLGLLSISLFVMILLTVLNIILRLKSITFFWIDPLNRHLVFLSAFLGGVLATGRGTHISIDMVSKVLESRGWHKVEIFLKRLIAFVSLVGVLWLVSASFDFFQMEKEFGKESFWGIHSSTFVFIIPLGFSLIGFRFFVLLLKSFSANKKEAL